MCATSMHLAAHLSGAKERRFLVDEQHEAPSASRRPAAECARQLDQRRDAGAVVVGARRAVHRIVMRTDDDDVAGTCATLQLNDDVANGRGTAPVFLALNVVACFA